jgi:hypothetical protein
MNDNYEIMAGIMLPQDASQLLPLQALVNNELKKRNWQALCCRRTPHTCYRCRYYIINNK